ncbi:MAG: Re/Si-specific NAD(P)(+) transhydrogenase subunit alpha [Hyphomicrobiales bacterium]
MKIVILRERRPRETRVAASPDSVKSLSGKGADVTIESGAGRQSNIADASFKAAGAKIARSPEKAVKEADVILAVRRPPQDIIATMKSGAVLIGLLSPYGDAEGLESMASYGITAFAMELMPRIARAQPMDAISSQANLSGYKAVIDAAARFGRAMPMMMTAAGMVTPARVFVMGAGVAGLQAIATARRLGAVVSATDVRRAAGEQVESLGAKFIMVEEGEEATETAQGYAREMSTDYRRRQTELVAEHVKNQDIVIATALVPGRSAPRLISQEMVATMKPGSIIVDLAVEQGGNCALSKLGETVTHKGVRIMGHGNLACGVSGNASALYAQNLINFLGTILDDDGGIKIRWDDEIIAATGLTHDGKIISQAVKRTSPQPTSVKIGTIS